METKLILPNYRYPNNTISILEFTASDGRKSIMYSTDNYVLATYQMTLEEIIEKFNPSGKELEAIKNLLKQSAIDYDVNGWGKDDIV